MGFSRQEHWSGLPFPSPGDLPNPGIKPGSPGLQVDSFPSEPSGPLRPLSGLQEIRVVAREESPVLCFPSRRPAPAAMRPARTALCLRLTLALGLALVGPMAVGWASARAPIYVSSWAVRVSQGYQEVDRLARKFGFVNFGQVGGTQIDGRRREDVRRGPRSLQMGGGPSFPIYQGPPAHPCLV